MGTWLLCRRHQTPLLLHQGCTCSSCCLRACLPWLSGYMPNARTSCMGDCCCCCRAAAAAAALIMTGSMMKYSRPAAVQQVATGLEVSVSPTHSLRLTEQAPPGPSAQACSARAAQHPDAQQQLPTPCLSNAEQVGLGGSVPQQTVEPIQMAAPTQSVAPLSDGVYTIASYPRSQSPGCRCALSLLQLLPKPPQACNADSARSFWQAHHVSMGPATADIVPDRVVGQEQDPGRYTHDHEHQHDTAWRPICVVSSKGITQRSSGHAGRIYRCRCATTPQSTAAT